MAEPPTAVIGGIDMIAIGCIVEAQARGMSVPGGLSVAGIDDLDMSAHLSPSLTTVHVPTARIGAETALMLLRAMRGDATRNVLELPVELVVRRSSGPPRTVASSVFEWPKGPKIDRAVVPEILPGLLLASWTPRSVRRADIRHPSALGQVSASSGCSIAREADISGVALQWPLVSCVRLSSDAFGLPRNSPNSHYATGGHVRPYHARECRHFSISTCMLRREGKNAMDYRYLKI